MATMNISLPDAMKAWAEEQARGGRYANVSDYVRDLIRRDQAQADKRAALYLAMEEAISAGMKEPDFDRFETQVRTAYEKIRAMQKLIDEALESGVSERSVDEVLADARSRATAKLVAE